MYGRTPEVNDQIGWCRNYILYAIRRMTTEKYCDNKASKDELYNTTRRGAEVVVLLRQVDDENTQTLLQDNKISKMVARRWWKFGKSKKRHKKGS